MLRHCTSVLVHGFALLLVCAFQIMHVQRNVVSWCTRLMALLLLLLHSSTAPDYSPRPADSPHNFPTPVPLPYMRTLQHPLTIRVHTSTPEHCCYVTCVTSYRVPILLTAAMLHVLHLTGSPFCSRRCV
jgi:hypothetical protein